MPKLTNPKHEHFARLIAEGVPASKAYVDVGYKKNDGNAVRLKGNEKVARRVEELMERSLERHDMTKDRFRS